jgi:hypothetical protein
MANTKQLPPEVLRVVANQIGERLGVFQEDSISSHLLMTEEGEITHEVDLGESFEVWTLPAEALDEFENDLDLPQIARSTGYWHHQIRSDKKALSFARSKPLGSDPESWSLRELFVSPLAEKVERAIDWIEEMAPEDVEVRYLSVPQFQVEAFWHISDLTNPQSAEWNNRVLIISAHSPRLSPLDLLSSREFLKVIYEGKRGTGLR